MDYTSYFKSLENTLVESVNAYEMKKKEWEKDKFEPINDFLFSFLLPIHYLFLLIQERVKIDDLIKKSDLNSVPHSSVPLGIDKLYECLSFRLPYDFASFVVGKLDGSAVVKNDILESIKNEDFESFNNTLRINNIDFTIASDICSYVNNLTDLEDNRNKFANQYLIEGIDDNNFDYRFHNYVDSLMSSLEQSAMKEGIADEDWQERKDFLSWYFEEVEQLANNKDYKSIIELRCITEFNFILAPLHNMALKNKLLSSEVYLIKKFIEKKKEEIPFVKGFLSQFTKGQLFHSDFCFFAENTEYVDFMKLLDDCAPRTSVALEHITSADERKQDNPPQSLVVHEETSNSKKDETIDIDESINAVFKKYSILETDRARKYLRKAIENEYITIESETRWRWVSLEKNHIHEYELSYLLSRIYFFDRVKEQPVSEGKIKARWNRGDQINEETDIRNALKKLFDKDMLQSRSKRSGNAYNMKRYKDVDKLFGD